MVEMEEGSCTKVYPTAEELSSIYSKVECPQNNCSAFFQSTSNLNMHLIKHHKVNNNGLMRKSEAQYFCPTESCPYFRDSRKYFTKLKYLKQHFLKVHASKVFACNKCGKKFSTESFKTAHIRSCGKEFVCVCGFIYNSSEAIMTHVRRKGEGHAIVTKDEVQKRSIKAKIQKLGEKISKKTERLIYPKLPIDVPFPVHYVAAVALSELSAQKVISKAVQTDSIIQTNPIKGHKKSDCLQKPDKKRKSSQHTQTTVKVKKLKISAQTQTNSDYYLKHKIRNSFKTVPRKRKKSMETQTKYYCKGEIKTNMENGNSEPNVNILNSLHQTQSQFDDLKIDYLEKAEEEKNEFCSLDKSKGRKWLWDSQFFSSKNTSMTPGEEEIKNNLFDLSEELSLHNKEPDLNELSCLPVKSAPTFPSEQNSDNHLFDLNKLCNIETQTEIDSILTECDKSTSFTMCLTTETQTTDDFDSLLYSNMCTQTCEDVDELFDFNFVNIETQTTWPDF